PAAPGADRAAHARAAPARAACRAPRGRRGRAALRPGDAGLPRRGLRGPRGDVRGAMRSPGRHVSRGVREALLALSWALLVPACTVDPEAYVAASAEDSAAADRAIERGEHERAIERLRAIAEREVPASVAEEDARVIRQDAYDRWARVLLGRGDVDAASGVV